MTTDNESVQDFNLRSDGPFAHVALADLFNSCLHHNEREPIDFAIKWVESEYVLKIRSKCNEWFRLMVTGEHKKRLPDPMNDEWSEERARHLVEELEADFEVESGRWKGLNVEDGPGFDELTGPPLIAFAQDLGQFLKTDEEIEQEAKERFESGEEIPPKESVPYYFRKKLERSGDFYDSRTIEYYNVENMDIEKIQACAEHFKGTFNVPHNELRIYIHEDEANRIFDNPDIRFGYTGYTIEGVPVFAVPTMNCNRIEIRRISLGLDSQLELW